MAISYGSDGTLYCNTVKYNYKQCRNIVADSLCAASGFWTKTNVASIRSVDVLSDSCFQVYFNYIGSGTSIITQSAPRPIANHKYYGGLMFCSNSGFSTADARFEWFHVDGDTNNCLTFCQQSMDTNGSWVKLSNIVTAGSSPSTGSWVIRNFRVSPTAYSYNTRMMIIDLTEAFGAGSEPSKEWCDENILEWNTYFGFGEATDFWINFAGFVTQSNYTTSYSAAYKYAYGALNDESSTRDYSYIIDRVAGSPENYCSSAFTVSHNNTDKYYVFYDGDASHETTTADWYWPVAEPSMGGGVYTKFGRDFCGGGGMRNWKRISFFNGRSSFSSGSSSFRLDLNRGGASDSVNNLMTLTNINIINITEASRYFYDMEASDINKEWCDRNVGGTTMHMIRVRDHQNKLIMFGGRGLYQELEYIEANGTQQIDTGVKFNMNTDSCEVGFQSTVTNQNGMIFASANSSNHFWFYHYINGNGINLYINNNGSQIAVGSRAIDTNKHTMTFKNKQYSIDGTLLGTDSRALNTTTYNMYLCSWGNDYYYKGRIYNCKIYSGSTLVRDLVPVRRLDTFEVGMYDKVNNKFYANSGSGAFAAGPAVNTSFNDGGNPTDYDIMCNDIIMSSYNKSVVFMPNGVIACRKLVRNQQY